MQQNNVNQKARQVGISVLMSIYDGEQVEVFNQAIRSVWDGQSLKPLQIVLVLDGFNFVFFQSGKHLAWIETNTSSEFDYWDAPLSHHVGYCPWTDSNVICDLLSSEQTALR